MDFSSLNFSSIAVVVVFFILQFCVCVYTQIRLHGFRSFFRKKADYALSIERIDETVYPQIDLVGQEKSDLNFLIAEINNYLFKTKGTSDYEFIRNKVERKLKMCYDQSTVYLVFPTYFGLLGTFLGVFMGIYMFLQGMDEAGNISDESIKNLLNGVLVSMFTSFVGLLLSTFNNGVAGAARKQIDDDKNAFYDFIQTEVTKTANASLVAAISNLHDTVDRFEPAFTKVIEGFKSAFEECTKAFGDDFKENVQAVTKAVKVMGQNMDKINQNVELHQKLLSTIKSQDMVRGMDKYIEAANHFVGITKSLNKFEEARRMMLAAAQEAIEVQNTYNESLKIPMEVAIRINQILERIKDFENNLKQMGEALVKRDILGNDIVNTLQAQINAIKVKSKIADSFLELADGKLEDLYKEQTAAISNLNNRYQLAIESHIVNFGNMLDKQTAELETRHNEFMKAVEDRFSVEDVCQEFIKLRKLDAIDKRLSNIAASSVTSQQMQESIGELRNQLDALKEAVTLELAAINKNTKENKGGITLFGRG